MNQIYSAMPASDFFAKFMGQFNFKLSPYLEFGIWIKRLFFLQHVTLGTGVIGKANQKLEYLLSAIKKKKKDILSGPINEEYYQKFRANIFNHYGEVYRKLEKLHFLYSSQIEKTANAILEEIFDIEFQIRKKAFPPAYKPNEDNDQELTNFASHISLTSAISLLEKDEI